MELLLPLVAATVGFSLAGLIQLLVVALVLVIVYYATSLFFSGKILQVIGLILGLVFLIYVLRFFGVA